VPLQYRMGFEESTYSKRLRLDRELANEFISCRQFLNGNNLANLNNDDLRTLVINNAIRHSFERGLLKTLTDLCDHSRLNGTSVDIHIETRNWEALVLLLGRMKRWGKLDEWDLIESCLKSYMVEMKVKRGLP